MDGRKWMKIKMFRKMDRFMEWNGKNGRNKRK
jgi:hypothetical protein